MSLLKLGLQAVCLPALSSLPLPHQLQHGRGVDSALTIEMMAMLEDDRAASWKEMGP